METLLTMGVFDHDDQCCHYHGHVIHEDVYEIHRVHVNEYEHSL